MQGAREFIGLFRSGQYGRLYIAMGKHARGHTLRIWVLPEGATTNEKTDWNAPSIPDIVEVYGIVSGQPGWTESYGWIHNGPWADDFAALVAQRKDQLAWEAQRRKEIQARRESESAARDAVLLSSYHSST